MATELRSKKEAEHNKYEKLEQQRFVKVERVIAERIEEKWHQEDDDQPARFDRPC